MKGNYEEFHALKAAKKQSQTKPICRRSAGNPKPCCFLRGKLVPVKTEILNGIKGYPMAGETVVVNNFTGKMIGKGFDLLGLSALCERAREIPRRFEKCLAARVR